MEEPDYVANIYISDLKGRMVRYLIKNNLLGTKGSFNWDGVDDTCKPLAQVSYYLN